MLYKEVLRRCRDPCSLLNACVSQLRVPYSRDACDVHHTTRHLYSQCLIAVYTQWLQLDLMDGPSSRRFHRRLRPVGCLCRHRCTAAAAAHHAASISQLVEIQKDDVHAPRPLVCSAATCLVLQPPRRPSTHNTHRLVLSYFSFFLFDK